MRSCTHETHHPPTEATVRFVSTRTHPTGVAVLLVAEFARIQLTSNHCKLNSGIQLPQVAQINSAMGAARSSKNCGRPLWSGKVMAGSMPITLYRVASTFLRAEWPADRVLAAAVAGADHLADGAGRRRKRRRSRCCASVRGRPAWNRRCGVLPNSPQITTATFSCKPRS